MFNAFFCDSLKMIKMFNVFDIIKNFKVKIEIMQYS